MKNAGGITMNVKKLWNKTVLFTVVFSISIFLASLVDAQSVREIAKKTFPSVVLLVMEDSNGQLVSIGSGFFVQKDIIVTNLHVIEGATRGYAKVVGQETKYNISGIAGVDEARDLVLLTVADTKNPVVSIGDSRKVAVGDEVYVIGNPQGLEGTFSGGIVSAIRKIESDMLFQITAPISAGSSGGPVLDSQGEVIGVAVATIKDGQNLNFAIPALYLKTLLSGKKSILPLATKTLPGNEKSIFDDFGMPYKYIRPIAEIEIILFNFEKEQLAAIEDLKYFANKQEFLMDEYFKEKESFLSRGIEYRESKALHSDAPNYASMYDKIQNYVFEMRGKEEKLGTITNLYPLINPIYENIYLGILEKEVSGIVDSFNDSVELREEQIMIVSRYNFKELHDFYSSYHSKVENFILELKAWGKKVKPLIKDTEENFSTWQLIEK